MARRGFPRSIPRRLRAINFGRSTAAIESRAREDDSDAAIRGDDFTRDERVPRGEPDANLGGFFRRAVAPEGAVADEVLSHFFRQARRKPCVENTERDHVHANTAWTEL